MKQHEFSRIIDIKEMESFLAINDDGCFGTAEATENEESLLAERFGMDKVSGMKVIYKIRKSLLFSGGYDVVYNLTAHVTVCDHESDIDETLELLVVPHGSDVDDIVEQHKMDVEPLDENGMVDLGEIAAQYLSLLTYL
jgi:hypothetical protein